MRPILSVTWPAPVQKAGHFATAVISLGVYAGNALAKADYDGFIELYKKLDEKARNNLEDNNVFWDRFEGKTAEVSTKVNDTYLKAHSQTDGVLSYGRMVDLMLADFYSDVTAD